MHALIKICGLSTPETLDAALRAGADMVGFVRFPKSPRHVALDRGRALSARAKGRALRTALVVDADDAELDAVVTALDPDLLQLHGHESVERVQAIRARFGRPVMKALGLAEASDLAAVALYRPHADRLLLDAKPPSTAGSLPGGNGLAFDWRLLAGLDPRIPFVLSGGLSPENVGEAIALTGTRAVDVSSGVEIRPGEKDPARIEAFVKAARAAFAALEHRTQEWNPLSGSIRCSPVENSASSGAENRVHLSARCARTQGDAGVTAPQAPNSFRTGPDETGHFGIFGGRFVTETLMPLILDLEKAYAGAKTDPAFQADMANFSAHYIGRPSPLYFAERMTEHLGGARIYFKREELNHTGAHKVNNVLGQILLARRMGKKRIIAETGAGQHGVATATLCARFGLECIVYMGAVDVERQKPNVFRMKMLGAEVVPVQSGTRTLKDAMNEALRDWVTNVDSTFYCIGTVAGPHPYPAMVRDFQCIIGHETREQMMAAEGRLPDSLIAAIGGGSNAIGLFHPFLDDRQIEIYGVEAAGHGLSGLHAASLSGGRPGVLHGNRTYLLMDDDGQIQDAHSISAGLDYPGIGPEHAWLHETGRVTYLSATDDEALEAFQLCCRLEGIVPALEPAHALAKVMDIAPRKPKDHLMVVNLSGRGDKDIDTVAEHLGGGL